MRILSPMPEGAKHILLLSSWFPTESHPFLGNFVERHARLLTKEYRVTVINVEPASKEKLTTEHSVEGGYTLVRAQFKQGNRLLNRVRKFHVLKKALRTVQHVDLVIGHVALPNGWMFLKAAQMYRCPLIWVEHGSYFRVEKINQWSAYHEKMVDKLSNEATEIVAVSRYLKADMEQRISREIAIIGNHVDSQLFYPTAKNPSGKKQFLHISTLDENTKNPKGIIDAIALLAKETTEFHVTIISDEDPSEIKRYAEICSVTDFITFQGPLSWSAIPPFYHKSDAFLLFSDYETFSIVLAEALATGTPVITTKVGIAREIAKSGKIVVEKQDSVSLKNAMLSVVRETKSFDYEKIVQQGRHYLDTSILEAWKAMIEKYVG